MSTPFDTGPIGRPDALAVGERRQFHIKSCLGRGGFGEVYRATMVGAGGVRIEVAVKVLHADVDPNSQAVQRLKDEARLMGAVHHPSVLAVHGLVLLENRVALVTEYVEGQDLDKCVSARESPIGLRALIEVTAKVAEALEAAYDAPMADGSGRIELIHRDIKPANIRVGRHGEVKLLDFGIARAANVEREAHTETNAMLGSYLYMAPERFLENTDSGPAVDVFALGATLYEGIAKKRLFGEMALKEMYLLILDENKYEAFVQAQLDLLPREVPHQIVTLVYRMLALDPKQRPTEHELSRACYELADKLPGPPLDRWARQREWPPPRTVRGMLDGSVITETGFSAAGVARFQSPLAAPLRAPRAPMSPIPSESFEGMRDLARTASSTFERPGVVVGVGVGLFGVGTAMLAAILVVVIVTVALWWVLNPIEVLEPGPQLEQPAPPDPQPVVEAPKVAPAPKPDPAPEPGPAPKPDPVVVAPTPVAPTPRPVQPVPQPPAPAAASATVRMEGGILVDFVNEKGSRRAGPMPPGSYQMRAYFEAGTATPAGTLFANPGEQIVVRCSKLQKKCERVQ